MANASLLKLWGLLFGSTDQNDASVEKILENLGLTTALAAKQPLDPTLTALAALVGVANKLPYFNGGDTAALTNLTQVGRDIIGKSTIADILTYLGLTTALAAKQPLDATLSALAGLATGANKLPYFTGNDTAAQTDLTSVGRDIIGKNTIADILTYLGLGAGAPPIGIPFFWPLAAMPNTVMDEWANMVFLKPNGASFSAAEYPKLAKVWTGLVIPDMRGEFPRIWDDGRGVDSGRTLLSAQGDAIRNIVASMGNNGRFLDSLSATFSGAWAQTLRTAGDNGTTVRVTYTGFDFDASRVVPVAAENRPRNIAFNFLVRAK